MRWVVVFVVALGCDGSERLLARAAPFLREPCEPEQIVARASGWLAAGELRRLFDETDAWERRCGLLPKLVRRRYEARTLAGDHRGAIGEASRLIARGPDADALAWRAAAWERIARLDHAADDYASALESDPRRTKLLGPLLDVDFRRHRPCHTASLIRRLTAREPALASDEELRVASARLRQAFGTGDGCVR